MQSYEELFFSDEINQKIARLTYYLSLNKIANSSWLQNQIRERTGKETYLLNPGIDTDVFYPYMDIDKKYNDLSKIVILSYYAPAKLKDWDSAVKAMKIVFDRFGNDRIKWVVFGGNPSSLPDIPATFVGKVSGKALAKLYSESHIVFMNSWYESFPLPPIEGMACGTAVITTRFGTEDYAFDGDNSIVIPPKKPESLANAIIQLVENPVLAKQLAKKGVITSYQHTWNNATDELEKIFKQVLLDNKKQKFADITNLINGNFD